MRNHISHFRLLLRGNITDNSGDSRPLASAHFHQSHVPGTLPSIASPHLAMTTSQTPSPSRSRTSGIVKVTYTHDAMIDVILQEPTVTTKELSELFGYSPAWVSRILASDAFQARLADRKSALVDPVIAQSVNTRMKAVVIQATDIVREKLDAEASASYAIEALGLASKALGLGGGKRGQ